MTASQPQGLTTPAVRIADARRNIRHVFVRDLTLEASIGVHDHEKVAPQRVRINVDMAVWEGPVEDLGDDIAKVVCYEDVINRVRALFETQGHINLVETLAEKIAAEVLSSDAVRSVRVRVEKLQAIADAASVGVEIERFRA